MNTDEPPYPEGMPDNSPAFQRWAILVRPSGTGERTHSAWESAFQALSVFIVG